MIKLTKRLQECVKYTKDYEILADIGTDHALLVSYAVLNNYVKYGIASDVAKGPLEFAQKTIDKNNLKDRVKTVLANGLVELDNRVDVCVIAGMGGILIADILENGKEYIGNVKRFITQPNISSCNVREWIGKNGYKIIEEQIIEDSKKIYEIIVFEKGTMILSKEDIYFGPLLLKQKNQIFIKKHTERIEIIKKILSKMPNDDLYRIELEQELELIIANLR